MSLVLGALLTCPFGVATLTQEGQQEIAKKIIERAINAHGGKANLTHFARVYFEKAALSLSKDKKTSLKSEHWISLDGRFRSSIRSEGVGAGNTLTLGFDGKKGWLRDKNGVTEYEDKQLHGARQKLTENWGLGLIEILDNPMVKITPTGESEDKGFKLIGVRVSGPNQLVRTLYFEKEQSYLSSVEFPYVDQQKNEHKCKEYFLEHNVIKQIKFPTRFEAFLDGEKMEEGKIINVKLFEKDDSDCYKRL